MFLPLRFSFIHVDVHPVSPVFHRAFVAKEWLLLPETWIIEAYYNAKDTGEFPNIDVC